MDRNGSFIDSNKIMAQIYAKWRETAAECKKTTDALFLEDATISSAEQAVEAVGEYLRRGAVLSLKPHYWAVLAELADALFYLQEHLRVCSVEKAAALTARAAQLLDGAVSEWMTETAFYYLQTSPDALKKHWTAACKLTKDNGWHALQTLCEYALARFSATDEEEYAKWKRCIDDSAKDFFVSANGFFEEKERGRRMISDHEEFYKRHIENKDKFQLKRVLIKLFTRRGHLIKAMQTGLGRCRRPSYHVELLVLEQRVLLVQKELQKREEENEDAPKLPIERFLEGQANNYHKALCELRDGKKVSHWMWYVFPQLRFLGYSDRARYYGIADLEEAKAYCANEILHKRYLECCRTLYALKETDPVEVMGEIDARKLRSSLTLFHRADEENADLYAALIKKFYGGEFDRNTMRYLERGSYVKMQLQEVPFQKIKHGFKTVEARLNDAKRRNVRVGSRICFINEDDGDTVWAEVVDLHRFETFQQLFESELFSKCGFQGRTPAEAVECMYEFYSKEEEKECGVVGIELVLTDETDES